ncbi:MAG TPA: hypothetical protein VJZ00_03525, partial [Thermoanaerobaculia bacterium]|nr:hypothetical protein [Thermoanaerobaculia bacterium]
MRELPAGTFFGRTVRTWQTSALAMSESVYEPHTVLAAHAHARPYLCLVLQGGHDETSGADVRQCVPATVVVHPAGERHANRFAPSGGRLFRLELDETWLTRCGGFDAPAQFDGGPLSLLANRIFREFRGPDDLSPLMIEALAMEFAASTARTRAAAAHRGEPAWLRRVQEYLHAHYAESIRLETLAGEAGVHAAHLNRAFRARHG